ncbi:MAG: PrsW family intramembrane metalloprotease [Candidatus Colwellbacteria bacterium]|nr:PrsW family intramembrane metalloprotease [Candidatus Colwellbacteria bacterium]
MVILTEIYNALEAIARTIDSRILFASASVGVAIGLVWLAFFLLEDREKPEPRGVLAIVFLLGMVSAWVAAGFEFFVAGSAGSLGIAHNTPPSLLANSLIEETVKWLVVFLAIRWSRYFDEKVDFMVYMITAALGFAAMENLLFLYGAEGVETFIGIAVFRFIGASLMHALTSGFLGFFWARRRLLEGLVIATLIHGIFNYLILSLSSAAYAVVFVILFTLPLLRDFDILKESDAAEN